MDNAFAVVTYREDKLISVVTTGDPLGAQRLFLRGVDDLRDGVVRGMVYTIEGRLDPDEVRTAANAPYVTDRYSHLPPKGVS